MNTRFLLNHQSVEEASASGTLLLDIIRRNRKLTGTKEACREGDCGACQILLGQIENGRMRYQAVNACLLPLGAVSACHVVTIEGLNGERLNPIQQALVDNGAIQCGFCTPGLVIALTGFFLNSATADEDAAIEAIGGNLCRCTGYAGIKRAIGQLCRQFDLSRSPLENRISDLIDWKIVPAYFSGIADRLAQCAAATDTQTSEPAVLVAGGTDLFVQRPEQLLSQTLYFLKADTSAPPVRCEQNDCIVDALATVEQLRTSPLLQALFPAIGEDFNLICSAPVRQRATVGGNLINASPIGDLAVFFLVQDARLTLLKDSQTRTVALKHFFRGYKQIDLKPGERLLDIRFEMPESNPAFNYEKVSKRTYLDIASVNSAIRIEHSGERIQRIHLSAGGVAPFPLYLAKTCGYLTGKSITPETVKTAAETALGEIAPISDSRGSEQYKRLLLRQLIYAHFLKLFPETISWETIHAR